MPIEHSKSPELHSGMFREKDVDETCRYLERGVPTGDPVEVVQTLSRLGFEGCSITMPLKEGVHALLKEYAA